MAEHRVIVHRLLFLLIAACALYLPRAAPAQPVGAEVDLDPATASALDTQIATHFAARLQQAVADNRNSAFVVIYVRDGKVRLAHAGGVEEPQHRVPVTLTQSRFPIASISKSFVGVAVTQLKRSGRIQSYDDPANRYLTSYKLPDADGHAVTLKQLATHTSGFDDTAFGMNVPEPRPGAPSAADYRRHQPLFFRPPGELFAYSQFGFNILGLMVADISGMTYSRYVETAILEPLGMTQTVIGYANSPEIPHEVRPFEPATGRIVKRTQYFIPMWYPCCGIFSTGQDMGRFMLALLDRSGAQSVITAAMQDEMFQVQFRQTPMGGAHSMAFELGRAGNRSLVYHSGEQASTFCQVLLMPSDRAGLFYCLGNTPPVAGLPADRQPLSPLEVSRSLFKVLDPAADLVTVARAPGTLPAAWNPSWNAYLGDFIFTGRQHFGIGRLRWILHPNPLLHVVHGSRGLEIDGTGDLTEVSHGVFQSAASGEYFSFFQDPRTGHFMFNRSAEANAVYEKPGPGENPRLMVALLAAVIALAATGVFWRLWPGTGGATLARAGTLLFGISMIGATLSFGAHPFGDLYYRGIGWPILIMRIFGFLVIPAALALTTSVLGLWRGAGSYGVGILGRLHLLILALAAYLAVAVLVDVGVIGFYIS
jgi:CubicO group peptidase (beta-lactamase class C family)